MKSLFLVFVVISRFSEPITAHPSKAKNTKNEDLNLCSFALPLLRSMAFHWRLIALHSLKRVLSINRSITRLRYPLRYRGFGCARSLLVPLQSGLPEYSFSCPPSQQSVICTFYGLYHAVYKAWDIGLTKSGLIHRRDSRGSPFFVVQKTP